jgi:hypothetical protein
MDAIHPLVQIAIGVATVVFVVIAVAVVRALNRLAKAVDLVTSPTGPVADLLGNATRTSIEVRALVVKLEAISDNLSTVATSFRTLGDRALSVSAAVLDEVEPPVQRAVSLARGVRAGVGVLVDRWAR